MDRVFIGQIKLALLNAAQFCDHAGPKSGMAGPSAELAARCRGLIKALEEKDAAADLEELRAAIKRLAEVEWLIVEPSELKHDDDCDLCQAVGLIAAITGPPVHNV